MKFGVIVEEAKRTRGSIKWRFESTPSEHQAFLNRLLISFVVPVLIDRGSVRGAVYTRHFFLESFDAPMLGPQLPCQRLRRQDRLKGLILSWKWRRAVLRVVIIPVKLLKQTRVISALVGAPGSRTSAADGIDAVTFHLSVPAGIARKHLALLTGPLLGRAIGRMRA
jgi:hypothetical protein